MPKQKIPVGKQRFDKQLSILAAQLKKAGKNNDSPLLLYKNGARTPLFMLESLARIYRNIHNKKMFSALYADFKTFEDLLGAIDYYDVLHSEFSAQKNIPAEVLQHFEKGRNSSAKKLRKILRKEKWLSKKGKQIQKINNKLEKASWLPADIEIPAKATYFIAEIQKIKNKLSDGSLGFADIETGVHELRRKLRWLSIYPQSLNGLIQLAPQKNIPGSLRKYVSPKIANSPFNKMPEPMQTVQPIFINANNFYALSWIIAELGRIKDEGLKVHALAEAIEEREMADGKKAMALSAQLCGKKDLNVKDLLSQAKTISEQFIFKDKVLDRLEDDFSKYKNI